MSHKYRTNHNWHYITKTFSERGYEAKYVKPGAVMDVITPASELMAADQFLNSCGCKLISPSLQWPLTIRRLCPGNDTDFIVTLTSNAN